MYKASAADLQLLESTIQLTVMMPWYHRIPQQSRCIRLLNELEPEQQQILACSLLHAILAPDLGSWDKV